MPPGLDPPDVPARPPDDLALVLSGGGARAAYQVGILAGIAERAGGGVRFPIITGVSAGAINAGHVASATGSLAEVSGTLTRAWLGLSTQQVFDPGLGALISGALRWGSMLASRGTLPDRVNGLLDTRPLHRTLSRFIRTEDIDRNIASGRLRALGISTTAYTTGETVTFVHGAEGTPGWKRAGRRSASARISRDHVLASCALPLLFPSVIVDGHYFGDGSMRQTAPLAPAIHLGARRMLVIALRYARQSAIDEVLPAPGPPPVAKILGLLFNSVFLDGVDSDAERLARINRSLRQLPSKAPHAEGLRPIELLVLRPSRDLGRLSSDLVRHLPSALRFLVRALGSDRLQSPDLLSYLLFEPPYIERLIELGRADARARWDEIARLLDGTP